MYQFSIYSYKWFAACVVFFDLGPSLLVSRRYHLCVASSYVPVDVMNNWYSLYQPEYGLKGLYGQIGLSDPGGYDLPKRTDVGSVYSEETTTTPFNICRFLRGEQAHLLPSKKDTNPICHNPSFSAKRTQWVPFRCGHNHYKPDREPGEITDLCGRGRVHTCPLCRKKFIDTKSIEEHRFNRHGRKQALAPSKDKPLLANQCAQERLNKQLLLDTSFEDICSSSSRQDTLTIDLLSRKDQEKIQTSLIGQFSKNKSLERSDVSVFGSSSEDSDSSSDEHILSEIEAVRKQERGSNHLPSIPKKPIQKSKKTGGRGPNFSKKSLRNRARMVPKTGHKKRRFQPSSSSESADDSLFDRIKKVPLKSKKKKRRISCTICDKSFANYTNKKDHINTIHKNKKAYKCPVCRQKFGYLNNQRRHIRMVHNYAKGRIYRCNICSQTFKYRYNQKKHTQTVHQGIRLYGCTMCSKKFSTRRHQTDHIKAVHEKKKDMLAACALKNLVTCKV